MSRPQKVAVRSCATNVSRRPPRAPRLTPLRHQQPIAAARCARALEVVDQPLGHRSRRHAEVARVQLDENGAGQVHAPDT